MKVISLEKNCEFIVANYYQTSLVEGEAGHLHGCDIMLIIHKRIKWGVTFTHVVILNYLSVCKQT